MKDFSTIKILDNSLENILWFVALMLAALIFKRYISKLLGSILYRFFRRYSEENKLKSFNELLVPPMQWLVFLFILTAAINVLRYPAAWNIYFLDTHLRVIITGGFKLITAIAFVWLFLRIVDFITLLLKESNTYKEHHVNSQLVPFIKDSLKVTIVILSIFFILGAIFRLNVASLIAGLGVGGLAVALAAQESLKNLLASITIFLDKPFKVGDVVTAGTVTGTVEKIGFRSTRLRTPNKTFLTLPNKVMVESWVDNLTLRNAQAVNSNIILSYGTSLEQVKAVVKGIDTYLRTTSQLFSDIVVRFDSFTDNGLRVNISYFVHQMNNDKFVEIKEQVNFKIMEIVQQQGVSFASNARVVEVKNGKA